MSDEKKVSTDVALSSWNDGANKRAIVDFVRRVTDEGGTHTTERPISTGSQEME